MVALEEFSTPQGPRADLWVPQQAYRDALTVRSYEVGRDGATRPGEILRYLEHLATTASAVNGFTNRWYAEHNGAWVVREMALLLGDMPRIDDELRLFSWVADFRRVQSTRDYLIVRADNGRLVVRASARWAYIDRTRLTPARIPEELLTRFGPWGHMMRERAAIPHHPAPAVTPADTLSLTAREYEADSQQHVNNCVYLDWFDEAARQASARGALTGAPLRLRPRYVRIEYIRSAQPGDAVIVTTSAPDRMRSRGLGYWQTATTAEGAVARAWTESLTVAR
jgi:acyl-CoA thioester hydrolase